MTAVLHHPSTTAPSAPRRHTWCGDCFQGEPHTWHGTGFEELDLTDGPIDPDEGRGASEVTVCLDRDDAPCRHGGPAGVTLLRLGMGRDGGYRAFGHMTIEQAESLSALINAHVAMAHGMTPEEAVDAAEDAARGLRARVRVAGHAVTPAPPFQWDTCRYSGFSRSEPTPRPVLVETYGGAA